MKPCPFCNSIDCLDVWTGSNYYIQCYNCGARGPSVPSFEEADQNTRRLCYEKWNQAERKES